MTTIVFVCTDIHTCTILLLQTWSLNKLLHLKTSFKPLVKSACKFIGSEDVNAILGYLSILEPEDLHTASDDPQQHCTPPIVPSLLSLGKVNGFIEAIIIIFFCLL